MDQPKVGAETQAYCTSCRTMQEHVIVAMVGTRPAKVECAECHKQHLFRAGPPGTKTASSTTRTAAAKAKRAADAAASKPSLAASELAAKIAGRDARVYDVKVPFAMGDVVRHPSFGVGLVTSLPGAQKMEVTFHDGAKLLAHDRAAMQASTLTRPVMRRGEDEPGPPSDAPPPHVRMR